MRRVIPLSLLLVLLALLSVASSAENDGLGDLDKATEAKLEAESLEDLGKVIDLLDSALKKGLDEGNTTFANQLLSATLIQRGTVLTQIAMRLGPANRQFTELRKLAAADLTRGTQMDPEQPEALHNLARLNLLPGGDPEQAATALKKALEFDFDDPSLRAKLLSLQAALEEDPAKKQAGLDEAIRLAPNEATALRMRGLLYADQDRDADALTDFNRAVELEPDHAPTHEAKAGLLSKMKRYDEAIVALDKAEELDPQSIAPLLQKARVYLLQENFQAALHELDRARNAEPSNLGILMLRAGIHDESGDRAKALADVDEALALQPGYPPAKRMKAVLLANDERFAEAIAELADLRRAQPTDETTLVQLAMLHSAAKQFADAVRVYDDLLKLQPDNWFAMRGRADALLSLGRHAEAIAGYEKAIKLEDDDSGLLNNFAWVLATSPQETLRDGKRAVELATKACELTEYKQAHILSTLASAHAEAGDFDVALKWIDKGLEVSDDGPQREHLQKERAHFLEKKPFRELLKDGEPVE
ncbi:MAG: tetratricopeptide repeat protein [Patescibacteria group bacterium]|nr:tetratricopeptide repeat protein [Patescibacteria group bacterium]